MMAADIDLSEIPVVILCGGQGTRIREATQDVPKPLLEIGGEPILMHIMRIYAAQGFRRFVLCLGYLGWRIKEFFVEYELRRRDFRLDFATGEKHFLDDPDGLDFTIDFAETGARTQTGARVKRIERLVNGDTFMLTYGDGVADIDLHAALAFHRRHGAVGTVTGVRPSSQFGELALDGDVVTAFAEKPKARSLINGGFFVFDRRFFDYLDDDPDCILERAPMERLAADRQLRVYEHPGFWRCMDTFKDYQELNQMLGKGRPPWSLAGGGT